MRFETWSKRKVRGMSHLDGRPKLHDVLGVIYTRSSKNKNGMRA